jgi:hypothetical protein
VDHALGQRQRAIADVDRQHHLALRVHGHPDPLGRPLQTLDGLSLTDLAVLDRVEQGEEFVQLYLPDPHIVQDVSGKGLELLRRLHQPLQHRVGVDLEDPRRAPDAQPLSQARDDPHDEVDGGALAMKDGAEGLKKIAATGDAEQLPPGAPIGMAIGAEIAPAHPAAIGTVRVGAEMAGGVDLTPTSARHDDAWGWGCRGVGVGVARIGTGVAVRLGGEAHKGFRLAAALAPWG